MFDPNCRKVVGEKVIGRWQNGMLGRDDFIPSPDFQLQNTAVGLIILQVVHMVQQLSLRNSLIKSFYFCFFYIFNYSLVPLLHILTVQVQFRTQRCKKNAHHLRISVLHNMV